MSQGIINYYDDSGNKVSKEMHDIEESKFWSDVNRAYEAKVRALISKINRTAFSDKDKLKALFEYFTKSDMMYNIGEISLDGRRALDVKYDFPPYKTLKIPQGTKYPAILNNAGVCETFSLAFEDISNRMGIPCRNVRGYTGMDHMWNIVLLDGQIKHIDIAYAIMDRNFSDKNNYFLKDLSQLIRVGGRTFMQF